MTNGIREWRCTENKTGRGFGCSLNDDDTITTGSTVSVPYNEASCRMNGARKKDKVDSCTLVPRSKQDETVRAVTLNVVSLVPRSLTASEELSNFDFPRISTGLRMKGSN